MVTCEVYYDLDFGLAMRYFGGKYTAEWRDVCDISAELGIKVSGSDREHICQIMTRGFPAEFNWEELIENKERLIRRNNNPLVKANVQLILKMLDMMERNHHVVPFPWWIVQASTYAHHTPQIFLMKKRKVEPSCMRSKNEELAYEITMNKMTRI